MTAVAVAVVGLGRLGLPFAALLSNAGHHVIGVDKNRDLVGRVADGRSPIPEPGVDELLATTPLDIVSTDPRVVSTADLVYLIVPTPSLPNGAFDNTFLIDAIREVGPHLRPGAVVVITSTVMPGSTAGPLREALEEATGRTVPDDIGVVYSPLLIALGSVVHDMQHPDLVIVGETDRLAGDLHCATVGSILRRDARFYRMEPVNAEIVKIGINQFITLKATWANQLAELCERTVGGDAHVALDAIGADSRVGHRFLRSGVRVAGPCLVRDSRAFARAMTRVGAPAPLAVATDLVNNAQTARLARRVLAHPGLVAVLGVSYKPGTPVTEESAGCALVDELLRQDRDVFWHDPLAGGEPAEYVAKAAVVVVVNDDPAFGDLTFTAGQHVIDCWGSVKPNQLNGATYERLGVHNGKEREHGST